jgi:hypothetical protein
MLQADVFTVLFMKELINLTNVIIGKMSTAKLFHKQNCSHDILKILNFRNCTIAPWPSPEYSCG